MNPYLNHLQPYPFEKLTDLLRGCQPPKQLRPLNISIGEPKHPVPGFLRQTMADALDDMSVYPSTRGEPNLRQAAAAWLENRFHLPSGSVNPEKNILPVNGTREALFSIVQAVISHESNLQPVVLTPNPFYQIYEGAAIMAGAQPFFVNATQENGFLPDYQALPPDLLDRVQLLFLCSPANPTGTVFPLERLQQLLDLADRHHFVLAADECYSEIWYEQPPPGLLQAAAMSGRADFRRCLVFHSLSKRSNMPGARSGFIAGDPDLLAKYFHLRTYTGCATPPFIQKAATAAWRDEIHVEANRVQYRKKLALSLKILTPHLPVNPPQAGFYLWLKVPGGGVTFARHLFDRYNVTVLPGAYLGRDNGSGNPGDPYVRVAMVATIEDHQEAMERIADCAKELTLVFKNP